MTNPEPASRNNAQILIPVGGKCICNLTSCPNIGQPANGAGMIFMPSNLDKYGGNSYMLIQTRDAVKVYKGTATGIPTNPNTVTELASYASPAAVIAAGSPVPFVTYELRYTPSTGAMEVYKAGALLGTYTDPAPLTFSQSILATTFNTTAAFDTVRVESQAPQVAGVGTIKSTNYSHTDHLGSGSLVTDSTGSLIEQLNYQPFGKDNVSVHTPAANGTMFGTKKKYTGKEVDDDTGLYYYGARYYNPAIARFISLDPVSRDVSQQALFVNPQRFNTYSYALNNPVKYTDPDGRWSVDWNWILGIEVAQADGGTNYQQPPNEPTLWSQNGPIAEAGTYTDADDSAVLLTDKHLDGTPATTTDKILSAAALAVPMASGKLIKKSVKGVLNIGKKAEKAVDTGKELYKFTNTAAQHMSDANRMIPIQTLDDIIKNPITIVKDPRGTQSMMYYSQMNRNGKMYNVEVLYDQASNTIQHFKYTTDAIGPLNSLPK